MKRTVRWPAHWSHRRERRGYWVVQGHTFKRSTPTAGAWTVRCPHVNGKFVGEGTLLEDAIDVLAGHLWDCRTLPTEQDHTGPEAECDPVDCAQSISDGYQPTCRYDRADHCNDCLMCPGHHVDGCRDDRPLLIHRIAGRIRQRGTKPYRMVIVHLPHQAEATA